MVRIVPCTSKTELYREYPSETYPQPAYIELQLRTGCMNADWNAVIGGSVPADVYYGFERRYPIPILTGPAANSLMQELAPLADRILADWEENFNGETKRAVLGDDAEAAEQEILARVGFESPAEKTFGEDQLVFVVDIDSAINGYEAEEFGITAETTGARLEEIAKEIIEGLADSFDREADEIVVEGLDEHLKELRTRAAED